ncbi:MAG: hypothetical protein HXS53_05395 [Theionarchaea archaeon]|nr:hypothetical protein [Theionarchaea archaeon]
MPTTVSVTGIHVWRPLNDLPSSPLPVMISDFTLVLIENIKGTEEKRKKEIYAFAINVCVEEKDAKKLCELYRNRWTVETSYWMLGEVRTKTTSKIYSVRWFFVLFGLLVRNGYNLFNDVIRWWGHVT